MLFVNSLNICFKLFCQTINNLFEYFYKKVIIIGSMYQLFFINLHLVKYLLIRDLDYRKNNLASE